MDTFGHIFVWTIYTSYINNFTPKHTAFEQPAAQGRRRKSGRCGYGRTTFFAQNGFSRTTFLAKYVFLQDHFLTFLLDLL